MGKTTIDNSIRGNFGFAYDVIVRPSERLSVRRQDHRTTYANGTAAGEIKRQCTGKLLFDMRHITNSFIANTSRKDRVFCRFSSLCVPSGSGVTPQIHARRCLLKIAQFHELCFQTDYSSVDGAL